MNVLEEFVSIQASPADVERYLTDRELLHGWVSPLVSMELLSGEWMATGSTYRLWMKPLFLLYGATYTLVERDSAHLRFDFEGIWRGTDLWHWFADGSRTIVQNRLDYVLPNPLIHVLLNGMSMVVAQTDMRAQMVQLRRRIEGSRQADRNSGP
jgi:hypothetical protein